MTSMVASGGLSVRTKLRLGTTYLPFLTSKASALDVHAPWRVAAAGLDEETIAEWGRERMGREFLDSLVYPQLAAYYGALPEETSAGFYHTLAHYGLDVSVYALRGGMSLLCEALAARVIEYGGRVRTATAVERAALTSEGARVFLNGEWEDFDALVMAVPGPAVLDLLDDPPPRLAAWLRGLRFRPALSIALLLERPVQARFFGLSFPRGQSDAVAAVCVEENKGPGLVPNGRGLLVAIARPEVAPSLLEAEPRAVFDAMIPDVERAFPGVSSAVSRGRVYRWPVGNPVFHPGYLAQLGELRDGAVEGDINLALAGDYLCSTSIEGAVTTGAAAAARITARLGSSPGASI